MTFFYYCRYIYLVKIAHELSQYKKQPQITLELTGEINEGHTTFLLARKSKPGPLRDHPSCWYGHRCSKFYVELTEIGAKCFSYEPINNNNDGKLNVKKIWKSDYSSGARATVSVPRTMFHLLHFVPYRVPRKTIWHGHSHICVLSLITVGILFSLIIPNMRHKLSGVHSVSIILV